MLLSKKMDGNLWGEIKTKPPVVTKRQREAVKPKACKPFLCSPHRIQDVRTQTEHPSGIMSTKNIVLNPVVLHSLNLRKYLRTLDSVLKALLGKQKRYSKKDKKLQFLLSLPTPPKVPDDPSNDSQLLLKYKNSAQELASLNLSHESIKMLIKKSIALILVHVGYDETSEGILAYLADVVEDYFKAITCTYRKYCDYDYDKFEEPFDPICPMEETFNEMGIDIKELHKFYVKGVIWIRDSWLKQCTDAFENYPVKALIRGEEIRKAQKAEGRKPYVKKTDGRKATVKKVDNRKATVKKVDNRKAFVKKAKKTKVPDRKISTLNLPSTSCQLNERSEEKISELLLTATYTDISD